MLIAAQQNRTKQVNLLSQCEAPPMPSKLDLVLIAVSIAAAIGLIERSHSIVIDPPDLVALATQATACSDEASVRYGISRMLFLDDGFVSGMPPRRAVSEATNCAGN
jgi:hypothetical protein